MNLSQLFVYSHTKTVLAQGSDAPAVIAAEVHELAQVDADSPATTLIVLPDYEAFADLMHLQEQETIIQTFKLMQL